MSRPSSLIYDRQARSLVFQVLLILALVFGAWWLGSNTLVNLAAQGKTLGFGFLTQTSGFQINATLGTWLIKELCYSQLCHRLCRSVAQYPVIASAIFLVFCSVALSAKSARPD